MGGPLGFRRVGQSTFFRSEDEDYIYTLFCWGRDQMKRKREDKDRDS